MVNSIKSELDIQRNFLGSEAISSIYFGGGTPSLLSETELSTLLETIHRIYAVNGNAEVTLEANPDDLSKKNLAAFKNAGVNRLSMGIQSFQDDLLKFLNRAHNSQQAVMAYWEAREAGIENISIDLIYAIPGLDTQRWQKEIERAISLNPEHLSCYSLTIEEKTAFGRWASKGKLSPVEDEISAQQLDLLIDTLERSGYEHYEISNFSRPGFNSRHNSSYWKQEKYLGVGPSAHSYNGATRQFNVRNNHQYIKAIQTGSVPAEIETLTLENKINEYMLTTLRTHWGTDLSKLVNDYQYDLLEKNSAYIKRLLDDGMAIIDNNHLSLTRKGKLLADKIASDLFVLKDDY